MGYTKRELNRFATKLSKLNSNLWDVICDSEDILNEDIAKELFKENNPELLKQIATIFQEKCQDGSAADTELHGATLSTACMLIGKMYSD